MRRITDFAKHNDEVSKLWSDYRAGKPARVPVVWGINARFLLLNPALNTQGITFEQYSNDPEVMLDVQLRFWEFVRTNIPQDAAMGLPEKWDARVDFQNYFEAGFLGAEIYYPEGNVPVSRPLLNDDNKRMLLDRGIPEPEESPLYQKNIEYYQYMLSRKEKGFEYKGRPIGSVGPAGSWTDGPLTIFMSIRGEAGLLDMYLDADYFQEMMKYLTEFEVKFARATRRLTGAPEMAEDNGMADDSIELISNDDYRRFILPWHRRLYDALGGGKRSMHVCGDVQRHFPTLVKELGIRSIDTGFPINWARLRDDIGEEVEIYGGPHIEVLRLGTPETVRTEARRILESGVTRGKKFVLREGNNLPPMVPMANLYAMYDAAKEYGRYE